MDFNSWSTMLNVLTVESEQYQQVLYCLTHTLLVLMSVLLDALIGSFSYLCEGCSELGRFGISVRQSESSSLCYFAAQL